MITKIYFFNFFFLNFVFLYILPISNSYKFIHLTDFKNDLCALLTQLFGKYGSISMLLFLICLLFFRTKTTNMQTSRYQQLSQRQTAKDSLRCSHKSTQCTCMDVNKGSDLQHLDL